MSNLIPKITNEQIATLPSYSFEGEIKVITNKEEAILAALELSTEKVLGFDTEAKPSFKKGEQNKVSLLQLSNQSKAFIFRINLFEIPNELLAVLESKDIIKAGAAIRDDIKDLQKIKNFKAQGFVEIQDMAKAIGSQNFGLRSMAALFLNIKISKGAKLTNWEQKVLTESQLRYAATDAWLGCELYNKIREFKVT